MNLEIISWSAAGLMLITSTAILISRDWRVGLGALAIQYIAVFWLVTRHLPPAMGSAKLIAGWMAVTVLGMTRLGLSSEMEEEDLFWSRGAWFRAILMGIVALAAAGATLRMNISIPGMGMAVIAGGLLLIGSGVLQVSVTNDTWRVTLGLLTTLAGFEVLYAAVESSILVTGLLAVVNLGLGIIGSYLLIAGNIPLETEEEL
jgi:hypothetical protein